MFEDRTPETLKREALEAAAGYGGGLSVEEGSFADAILGPAALMHWKVLQGLNAVLPIAFVDESSGGYIDKECGKVGIVRKAGTRARAEMTLTGRAGVTVPAGTVFCTAEGLEFELLEDVLLTGGGDKGTVEAVDAGSACNVGVGELSQMVRTVSGLDAWTNAAAVGGTDRESDEALLGRLNAYRQKAVRVELTPRVDELASKMQTLWSAMFEDITPNPFTVGFGNLDGLTLTAGVWNASLHRLEC